MSAHVIPTGKYKGQCYDDIVKINPNYIKYLIRKNHQLQYPIFQEWLNLQPKSPQIKFTSGKHKGMTYDEVWRRYPRYIFKIYDRHKGPMYDKAESWFKFHEHDLQKKRLKYASNSEDVAVAYFRKYNISFIFEFSLPDLPGKRFDFRFNINGAKYILEIDGAQHFKHTKYFHRSVAKFRKYQENDVVKSVAAMRSGYRLIRIDFSELTKLEYHLNCAIQQNCQIYFSNAVRYSYIIEKIKSQLE